MIRYFSSIVLVLATIALSESGTEANLAAKFDDHQFVFIGSTHGDLKIEEFLMCLVSRPTFTQRVVVAPVNREVVEALPSALESVPAVWMRLRHRWEYGHTAGFVVQLVGLSALILSVIVETSKEPPRDSARIR